MAEATLRDLIKVMNADMKASASADENQKKATYAVRDEVQRLTTLFNKFFLAFAVIYVGTSVYVLVLAG